MVDFQEERAEKIEAPEIPEAFIAEKPFDFLRQFATQLDAAASLDMIARIELPPIASHLVARAIREWQQAQEAAKQVAESATKRGARSIPRWLLPVIVLLVLGTAFAFVIALYAERFSWEKR